MFKKVGKYVKFAVAMSVGGYATLFAPTHFTKKHPDDENLNNLNHQKGEAVIFTWNPDSDNNTIGHQSALIRMKDGSDLEKEYISFWPSETALPFLNILPFKFINMGGQFLNSIDDDIRNEGRKPDNIVVISNLDYGKMLNLLDEMRKNVQLSKMGYRFFWNFPEVHRHISHANHKYHGISPLTQNPFSETAMDNHDHHHKVKKTQSGNCTSVIRQLMESGGYPKKPFDALPWGATPLGQTLEFLYTGGKSIANVAMKESLIDEARLLDKNGKTPESKLNSNVSNVKKY